jgi:hypothetical protein
MNELVRALETVIELAEQNVIDDDGDSILKQERKRQKAAIRRVAKLLNGIRD